MRLAGVALDLPVDDLAEEVDVAEACDRHLLVDVRPVEAYAVQRDAVARDLHVRHDFRGLHGEYLGPDERDRELRHVRQHALHALVPLLVLVFAAFGFFYTSGRAAILESGDAGKIAALEHISASSVRDILGAADAAISIFQAALLAGIVAFIMSVLSKRTSASEAVGAVLLYVA